METNNIIIIQGEEERKNGIHYEINPTQEPIGKGGTGIVRLGQRVDERTGLRRDVAIKFLYDDMPANILVRSQREASIRILSENLIEMIDFVQVNEYDAQGRTIVHSHVVSELLHGVMLLDILKGVTTDRYGKQVPAAKECHDIMLADRNQFALKIVRSVLSGIQALHDNGYIHRDIDPSNIMITDRGKVKLIDLGIAKKIDTMGSPDEQHLTSTGQFIGKAAYAAPELVLGDLAHQNETTDIYAIGVMLYLLVVGKLPFNGPLQEILNQQCKEKMPVDNIKDKNIRKIVKKATEKKQSERYQSAAEFRVAIDSVARQMKPVVIKPAAATPAAPVAAFKNDVPVSGTVVGDVPVSGTVVGDIPSTGTMVGDKPSVSPQPVSQPNIPQSPAPQQSSKKSNTLLYIIIAAVVAVAAIAALAFFIGGKSSNGGGDDKAAVTEEVTSTSNDESSAEAESVVSATDEPMSEPTPDASTSVTSSTADVSTAPSQSEQAAPATEKTKSEPKSSAKSEQTTKKVEPAQTQSSSGGLNLSYGKYTGPVKNGYPNGKGKLVYTTSRRINKYDSKGIVAQPGEYVEGMFVNGFLTVGKHYSASGELLNKISAGVAEGVYESK